MAGTRIGLMGAALAAFLTIPAVAQAQYHGDGYGYRQVDQRGYRGYDGRGYDGQGYDRRGYDKRGYAQPRYGYGYRANGYRGGRARCDRGTGGTILGAIAGGLLGNSAAGRGDRDLGTIVGAGVGALAGRAIDRDC